MEIEKVKYWVYNPINSEYLFYDNANDRDIEAALILKDCFDYDEWTSDVEDLKCGISMITHRAIQVNREDRPDNVNEDGYDENDYCWPDDCEFKCDYEIKEVK